MSFKEIRELIDAIDKSQISLMELNYEKIYLKLDKSMNRQESVPAGKSSEKIEPLEEEKKVSYVEEIKPNESKEVEVSDDDKYILSPMVGTVYLSPSPDKDPYVSVGDNVKQGDVVCIVEAMKLMNEIESEFSGTIQEVLVKNAQMVEFGQKLFRVR